MTEQEIAAQNEQLIRAYHVCFSSPAGQTVLVDLSAFCRAAETLAIAAHRTAPVDVNRTLVAIGRHDVWLRIQQFARLMEDEIMQLRLGRTNPTRGQENG